MPIKTDGVKITVVYINEVFVHRDLLFGQASKFLQ